MKTEIYTCDICNKEWDLDYDPSAYILEHTSLRPGTAIMGDNRIIKPKYFCKDCFDKIYKFITPVS